MTTPLSVTQYTKKGITFGSLKGGTFFRIGGLVYLKVLTKDSHAIRLAQVEADSDGDLHHICDARTIGNMEFVEPAVGITVTF